MAVKTNEIKIKDSYFNEIHYNSRVSKRSIIYADMICKEYNLKSIKYFLTRTDENTNTGVHQTAFCPDIGYDIISNRIDDEYYHVIVTTKNKKEKMSGYVTYQRDSIESKMDAIYKYIDELVDIPVLREWTDLIYSKISTSRCTVEAFGEERRYETILIDSSASAIESIIKEYLRCGIITIGNGRISDRTLMIDSLDKYITEYGSKISKDILTKFNVKFNREIHNYDSKLKVLSAYTNLKGLNLYSAQKDAIQAISNNINVSGSKTTLVVSEMGTGKTLLGSSAVFINSKNNVFSLVMCPPHLVEKWKREIENYIPDSKCFIIKNITDVDEFFKLKKNNVLNKNIYGIISSGVAKFEASKVPCVVYSRANQSYRCVECGEILTNTKVVNNRPRRVIQVPKTYKDFISQVEANAKCNHCRASLWTTKTADTQWVDITGGFVNKKELFLEKDEALLSKLEEEENENLSNKQKLQLSILRKFKNNDLYNRLSKTMENSSAEKLDLKVINFYSALSDYVVEDKHNKNLSRKYSIAKYINSRYKNQLDYLIIDELHEFSSAAQQGQAMASLAAASKKIIGLTGTLLNGYADGLFYILYRTMPSLIINDGFRYGDVLNFTKEYGIIKKSVSNRTLKNTNKKIPGISPLLFTKYMIDNTLFLSLSDMREGLPSYNEIPIGVNLEPEVVDNYMDILDQYNSISSYSNGDTTGLVGNVLHLLATYPDKPRDNLSIYSSKTKEILINVPDTEDLYTSAQERTKEAELLKIIEAKIKDGEKVLVYYNYSNNGVQERLKNLITHEGYKVNILKTGNAAKREEWINKELSKGLQVLICNPKLVETGLDLLDFTTIVFFDIGYNIFTVRQASRRSWRLSQDKPVDVYFLYYKNTVQETTLSVIAQKMTAAMTLEGKFSEEGLRSMSNAEEDIMGQVAKSLKENIDHTVKATFESERRMVTKRSHFSYLRDKDITLKKNNSTSELISDVFNKKQNILNII